MENQNQEVKSEIKNTDADMMAKIPKMMSDTQLQVSLTPIMLMVLPKEPSLRDTNPDLYYEIKASARKLREACAKSVEEMDKRLAEMA